MDALVQEIPEKIRETIIRDHYSELGRKGNLHWTPETRSEVSSRNARKRWRLRRERYGSSGRRPKYQTQEAA